MKISRSTKYLLLIFVISFILFFPSLKVFFTNDDFFLLKIAQADNFKEFLNFFNLTKGPDGLGMYRPLTTQVFYFLSWKLFNLNPIGLHIISFIVFFGVIFLVYKLAKILTHSENTSLVAAFLYATSATHFGHLYYLATFQELGMTLAFLLSVIFFINFLKKKKMQLYLFSFFAFLLSLLSKETAVVLPFVLILIYWFIRARMETKIKVRNLILKMVPFFLILSGYFYMRFFYYGFATGESYIWDFSQRAFNTLAWYGLWSLNLPEMLVDFVGPGVNINPNLFKFWSKEIIPIFILFSVLVIAVDYLIIKNFKKLFLNRKSRVLVLFCLGGFVITILPVLFLPLHKFSFYLTIPLVSFVIFLSYILVNHKSKMWKLSIIGIWTLLSVLTLNLTKETHWIVTGARTAKNVDSFFQKNNSWLKDYKNIVFYDLPEDNPLPWKPTVVLKTTLSDNNFFIVFYEDRYTVKYGREQGDKEVVYIRARQFLGY